MESNVGAHELFTPSELVGRGGRRGGDCDVQQSSYTRGGADKRKLLGGAARWTAVELDGQLTIISAHLPHKRINLGDVATVLTEIENLMRERDWEST